MKSVAVALCLDARSTGSIMPSLTRTLRASCRNLLIGSFESSVRRFLSALSGWSLHIGKFFFSAINWIAFMMPAVWSLFTRTLVTVCCTFSRYFAHHWPFSSVTHSAFQPTGSSSQSYLKTQPTVSPYPQTPSSWPRFPFWVSPSCSAHTRTLSLSFLTAQPAPLSASKPHLTCQSPDLTWPTFPQASCCLEPAFGNLHCFNTVSLITTPPAAWYVSRKTVACTRVGIVQFLTWMPTAQGSWICPWSGSISLISIGLLRSDVRSTVSWTPWRFEPMPVTFPVCKFAQNCHSSIVLFSTRLLSATSAKA